MSPNVSGSQWRYVYIALAVCQAEGSSDISVGLPEADDLPCSSPHASILGRSDNADMQ